MEGASISISVAVQQKSPVQYEENNFLPFIREVDYAKLTNEALHRKTLAASAALQQRCVEVHQFTAAALAEPLAVLVPVCEEIIARFKRQGVAAQDRPNGQPTVEQYFRSISLNYNTVRSWIHRHRGRLQTEMSEMFVVPRPRPLTRLELASNAVVEAHKSGANVDEAVKALEDAAPRQDFSKERSQPPKEGKLPNLALRLMCELESFFNGSSKPKMPKKLRAIADKLKLELEQERSDKQWHS